MAIPMRGSRDYDASSSRRRTTIPTVSDPTSYLNVDLVVEKDNDGYRASVVNSPGGEAETKFTAPFSTADFEALADQLDRSRGTRRIASPQLSLAKDLGGRLYRAVASDEIRMSLARARDAADRDGAAGIRLRLHLSDAPELAVLPWEFMFDPDPKVGRFLALAEDTPLVRYVDLPERVRPLKVSPPIRVLGVVSNPADDRYPELDVDREWQSLEEALAQPLKDGRLELLRLPRATISSLQDMLSETEANVLHFIGHGRFDEEHQDGVLAFEGERGGANEVSAERFGALLYNEKSLRLVVLNACEGGRASATDPYAGMAQTLVRMHVPAVVAMQFEITDRAAIVFARQFYKCIALGRPVDAAITDARMAIYQQVSEVEWATPVLYMRAPDGRVFDVAAEPLPKPEPTRAVDEPRTATRTEPAPVPTPVPTPLPPPRRPWRKIVGATVLAASVVSAGIVGGPWVMSLIRPQQPTIRPTASPVRSGATMRQTAEFAAGKQPDGIAVDESAGRIYFVNADRELRILDATSKRPITTARASGVEVAVDPQLRRVYVAQYDANTVAVFDSDGTSLGSIPMGNPAGPFAMAIHPATHRVYVANQNGNNVAVIDANTRRVVGTIPVGASPSGIAINEKTGRAYVANLRSSTVTIIDTARDQVAGTITVKDAPGRVGVAVDGDLVLVTNPDDDSMSIISGVTQQLLKKITVGQHPLGVLVDPDGRRAYVAVNGSGTVAVIDLSARTLDQVVAVGANPARLAYGARSRQLYVTNYGSGTISVVE